MKDILFKIHATGEEITVSSVSFKEMEDLFGKGSALPLLVACGYATSFVTEEQMTQLRVMYEGNTNALDAINSARIGHSITMLSDVDSLLTVEDSEAVFLHELGHVVNGHVKGAVENIDSARIKDIAGCKVVIDDEVEIEADAYAASVVGYHRVLGALNAVIWAASGVIAKHTTKASFEVIYSEIISKTRATGRYQELLKYTEGY
jgi:hypothetical protein